MSVAANIAKLEAFAFRVPLGTPVETSFGRMLDRPAVFVRVEDEDGVAGFGEAWCNFPSVGAEHRVRLIRELLAPLVVGHRFDEPAAAFEHMTRKTAVLAVQSGEHGPIAQAIAGIDTAIWDLFARRAGQPLWRMLSRVTGAQNVRLAGSAIACSSTADARAFPSPCGEGRAGAKRRTGVGVHPPAPNAEFVPRPPSGPPPRSGPPSPQGGRNQQSCSVPVYASGINPSRSGETAARARAAGHRAFKLKVGFGSERDEANLRDVRSEIGDLPFAVDANQAWTPEEAADAVPRLAAFDLAWLEEPIRADLPWEAWSRIKSAGNISLAGGENIAGDAGFAAAFQAGMLSVIQPDLAKWGGLTGCTRVARAALAAGRRFCPHYLGGGIGLLASAHLLAGVGGGGLLEIDVNPNPLRDLACGPVSDVRDGRVTLGEEPGLGITPDLEAFAQWRTL